MIASREYVKDLITKVLKKFNTYSTDEKLIGFWIDGKPLYRKILTGTTTGSVDSYYSLSGINYDIITNIKVLVNTPDYVVDLSTYSNTGQNGVLIEKSQNRLRISNNNYAFYNSPVIIILEYTKKRNNKI